MTGTVRDRVTREPLPGAHVVATDGASTWGAVTDAQGRYLLAMPPGGDVAVRVSFVGYQPAEFRASRDAYIDKDLQPGVNLPEVVITPDGQVVPRVNPWLVAGVFLVLLLAGPGRPRVRR